MAATIALAAVVMVAAASTPFAPEGRTDDAAVMVQPGSDLCRVVAHLPAHSSTAWSAIRPAAPLASAIVLGIERAQIDPLCLAMAFRDGKGWGALMTVAEIVWRGSMMTPWGDAWDVKARGAVCAAI